jgi:hypothetical protein
MTIIRRLFWSLPVWAALAALLVGCAEDARDVQLQKVAKDWSATIRASQVLPVYPLTEDLYPGDVFLVTMPIEDQVALYQRNGYLPLDQHVGRLTNLNFNEYYWNYYGTGNATDIAGQNAASIPSAVRWSFGPDGQRLAARPLAAGNLSASNVTIANLTIGNITSSGNLSGNLAIANFTVGNLTTGNITTNYVTNLPAASGNDSGNATNATVPYDHWDAAPRAAFPSYSFSVDNNGSLNLALPINGVPVGLSLLGGGQANGTVELADAYTYGLPLEGIINAVKAWAATDPGQGIMFGFPSGETTEKVYIPHVVSTLDSGKIADIKYGSRFRQAHYFIRVVTRVYLVRSVNVTLQVAANTQGGVNLGPNITSNTTGADVGNLATNLNTLNGLMKSTLPNADVRFTSFSNRTVSMSETFETPLVIGFLAYDFPITADGLLDPNPVSTFAQLNGQAGQLQPVRLGQQSSAVIRRNALYAALLDNPNAAAIFAAAAASPTLNVKAEYADFLTKNPHAPGGVALDLVVMAKYQSEKSPDEQASMISEALEQQLVNGMP